MHVRHRDELGVGRLDSPAPLRRGYAIERDYQRPSWAELRFWPPCAFLTANGTHPAPYLAWAAVWGATYPHGGGGRLGGAVSPGSSLSGSGLIHGVDITDAET